MQKIATRVFIYASLTFGVLGILWVILAPGHDGSMDDKGILLTQALMTCVFIILSSFALSVAGKYLTEHDDENK